MPAPTVGIEKRRVCYYRVYRFGSYLVKNKLYRADMDLFIKLPPMDATKEDRRPVCGFVAKRYIRMAK